MLGLSVNIIFFLIHVLMLPRTISGISGKKPMKMLNNASQILSWLIFCILLSK